MITRLFISLCICFLLIGSVSAQSVSDTLQKNESVQNNPDDGLRSALSTSLQNFDSAKVFPEMMACTNRFGLIAGKWNNQWPAQYYAGYSLVILSYIEKDQKNRDLYLDQAQNFIDAAWTLNNADSSEMYVLAAMHANARMAVIPASRYKKFGDIFNSNIEKAKLLNPGNPRIYYLQATNVYYTPKMFGGGSKNALPYFEKAESLYQKEKATDILKPNWGHIQNSELLEKCKSEK